MSNHKRAVVWGGNKNDQRPRRDDLMSNEDDPHVEANLGVIREYLGSQFKGFELTQDRQADSLYHWFTMTNEKSGAQYTLRVICLKLSDRDNTPENIKRKLGIDNVAEKMRTTKQGDYFSWGL
jgi:hypothetical protein